MLLNVEVKLNEIKLVQASFSLKKGHILGIVGPSGSGKSLTAKCLCGILPEELVGSYNASTLNCGYVFQDPLSALNPLMSIGRQIEEVCKSKDEMLEMLKWVGLEDGDKYPHQLSGGMRQRAVLAIALAQKPDILICDEATCALDLVTEEQILSLIERIKIERGLKIIFITHDWSNVYRLCDEVLVMHRGEIVERGNPKDPFNHPITKALIEACNPF